MTKISFDQYCAAVRPLNLELKAVNAQVLGMAVKNSANTENPEFNSLMARHSHLVNCMDALLDQVDVSLLTVAERAQ